MRVPEKLEEWTYDIMKELAGLGRNETDLQLI